MSADEERALRDRLADGDARVFRGVERLSLCPSRSHATRIPDLIVALRRAGAPAAPLAPLGDGLVALAAEMREAFPENIFWDLDYLAHSLARDAARADAPLAHLARALRTATAIQRTFGRATAIRFRYVHDFLYGFDWSKWVEADPGLRAGVGPFDLPFLERMERRGNELLALIAADDHKYGRLHGDEARNPFGFSRALADEERLMRDLAARGALPVEAWRIDATPTWDRPYYTLRQERADALGLALDAGMA